MSLPWRATSVPRRDCFGASESNPTEPAPDRNEHGEPVSVPAGSALRRRQGHLAVAPRTLITTGLVLAMVLVASLFFVAVDQTLLLIVKTLLSFGR